MSETMSSPRAVHLGVQLDGGDSIAKIDDGGSGVLPDDAVRFLDDGKRGNAVGDGDRLVRAADGVEEETSAGDGGVVLVPAFACGQKLFYVGGDGLALLAHLLGGGADSGSVEHLEGAKLPVEAGLHGLIDFDDAVGDLWNAVGGVGEEFREQRPVKSGGFVLRRIGVEQLRDARGGGLNVLRHIERGEFRPRGGPVVERLPVEHAAKVAAFGVLAFLLIKALPGLVAEPLLLDHAADEGSEDDVGALIFNLRGLGLRSFWRRGPERRCQPYRRGGRFRCGASPARSR